MQQYGKDKHILRTTTTSIQVRLLEIDKNKNVVLFKDENHEDGYYDFLIEKSELDEILTSDNPKESLYEHLAISYNRSFMEFLMTELFVFHGYLASIYIEDKEIEFSYLESKYMDESYLNSDIKDLYSEEFGILSDFDYYPYGMVKSPLKE